MRAAAAAAAPVDPRAAKIQLAQAKARVITKARDEARAKGMSAEDERAYVAEALKEFSEQQADAPAPLRRPGSCGADSGRGPRCEDPARAGKGGVITKAREEARAKGMSPEDERAFVAEALKNFSEQQGEHGDGLPCTPSTEHDLDTIDINVNVGPQHPATHGVFRMVLQVDGELVKDVDPVIGYMHRGNEKLPENCDYRQTIGYHDRTDYLAQFNTEHCFVRGRREARRYHRRRSARSTSASSWRR